MAQVIRASRESRKKRLITSATGQHEAGEAERVGWRPRSDCNGLPRHYRRRGRGSGNDCRKNIGMIYMVYRGGKVKEGGIRKYFLMLPTLGTEKFGEVDRGEQCSGARTFTGVCLPVC